jgi:lipopolysaccharide assembly outer membrane protein LptD (OstA)
MSYQQPYLYVISPSQDVVVSPQINSSVNPFLNVNYRKRFYSGYAEARMGYTYDKNIDSRGERFGEATSRSYILAKGLFDINDKWKWGFSAERASDKLLFDNYSINDVYQSRGLFTSEDRRLNSQIYTTRQDKQSYFSLSAISVQGLRVSGIDSVTGLASFENSDAFPLIGPLVEGRWQPEAPVLGGRLRVQGSGVVLTRAESPYSSTANGRRQPARQHQRRLALEHHPEVGCADLAVRPGARRRLSHHRPARDRQHARLFARPGRNRRRSELPAAQAPEERQHRARAPGPGRGRFGQPARADRGRNHGRHDLSLQRGQHLVRVRRDQPVPRQQVAGLRPL